MLKDEKTVEYPKRVIVDFDGTICGFAFPDTGPPEPGVQEGLIRLSNLGYEIVVHSVRTSTNWGLVSVLKHTEIIVNYMKEHNLYYDAVETNLSSNKPIAMAYIDDRGIAYRGDWRQAVDDVIALNL